MGTINQNLNDAAGERFNQIERNTAMERKRMLVLYKQSLNKIKGMIAKFYEQHGAEIAGGNFHQFNRLKGLEEQLQEEIIRLQKTASPQVKSAATDTYKTTYYDIGYNTETQLGVSLGFGLLNTKQIEAAIFREPYQIRWEKSMKNNHAVYYRDIKNAIATGIMQGKGYGEIAKLVQNRAEISASKTIRIINTETHRAAEAGTLAGYAQVNAAAEEFGLQTKKKWIATLDEATRPDHIALDGQYADENGLFHIGNYSAPAPGQFGAPEEDINCRCTTIMEIAGIDQEKRLDNIDKNVISYKDAADWKKDRAAAEERRQADNAKKQAEREAAAAKQKEKEAEQKRILDQKAAERAAQQKILDEQAAQKAGDQERLKVAQQKKAADEEKERARIKAIQDAAKAEEKRKRDAYMADRREKQKAARQAIKDAEKLKAAQEKQQAKAAAVEASADITQTEDKLNAINSEADKIYSEIENKLKTGTIKKNEELGGGANGSYKTKNGITGVFKPADGEEPGLRQSIPDGTYYKREVAAYEIDKAFGIGMVPPTTMREVTYQRTSWIDVPNPDYNRNKPFGALLPNGKRNYQSKVTKTGIGSHQQFMEGAKTWGEHDMTEIRRTPASEHQRLAFLDYILASEDRHDANYMVKNGKIIAIDNGLALGERTSLFRTPDGFILEGKRLDGIPAIKNILKQITPEAIRKLDTLQRNNLLTDGEMKSLYGRLISAAEHVSGGKTVWPGLETTAMNVLSKREEFKYYSLNKVRRLAIEAATKMQAKLNERT